MSSLFLSRNYLDSLSSSELISLADGYGIDIPQDLDRNFIIGELLEIAEEEKKEEEQDVILEMPVQDDEENEAEEEEKELPILQSSYNETQIGCVLRNPVWLFVFWDISNDDMKEMQEADFVSLKLHLSFYYNAASMKAHNNFEIQIDIEDREQFVLLPTTQEYCKVSLVAFFQESGPCVLCETPLFCLPLGQEELNNLVPGKDVQMEEIMKLSGKDLLLEKHYENHRQAFAYQTEQ